MTSCDYLAFKAIKIERDVSREKTVLGLIIALGIISLWLASLAFLLCLDITQLPLWLLLIAIFWQMFLYTGLFITAHDAIHGSVFPQNKKINHGIGSLAVFFYCFFPYKQMVKNHWEHHYHPASERDPDYHDGKRKNGFFWYFTFMKRYWSWSQFNGMTIVYNSSLYILHISQINFILFWIIPLALSSLQLFYFGTFLPHREPEQGYINPHRAKTTPFPVFWSFITCYHFGYHQEHHEYPHVPWWQLPKVYQQKVML